MRPTFSILCFTVLSGIGYGAWFLQGIGLAIGWGCGAPGLPGTDCLALPACRIPPFGSTGFSVALFLIVAGLLASVEHLGKPARAWRALTQWRTSWLSREGIAALLGFVPAAILILMLRRHGLAALAGSVNPGHRAIGALLAIGALATVYCTANIYASLKTIRAWNDRHVVPAYLLLALYGGTLLLASTAAFDDVPRQDRQLLAAITIMLALVCAWLKHRYWHAIDAQPPTTTGHATGLERLGTVRALEAPHTEENYLTHEMGFVLARKHTRKLRTIALALAFAVPGVLAALWLAMPMADTASWLRPAFAGIGLVSAVIGLLVERWLFFAQARHVVIAYYGR